MKLRPYQAQALINLRQSFASGHLRPLLQAPTAAGKTVIASEIIKGAMAKGNRVIFVCDRIELIDQTSATFDAFGIPHGVIQANHPKTNRKLDIQIGSIQTLARRTWQPFELIIVDEAHTQYKSLHKQLKKWNNVPVIGLSATPWSKGLGLIYDDLKILTTTKELIDDGYLCPFEVFGPPVDVSGIKTVRGDFDEQQLADRVNTKKIVGSVVKTYQEHGRSKPALCFAVNIAHSKALCEEFNVQGIKAVHLDHYTETEDRRMLIHKFKCGHIPVLCSVEVMTKGFDAPAAEVVIIARPTKSAILHVQMIGRGLRIMEGKKICTILDHAGNHERLGFVTDTFQEHLCTKEASDRTKDPEKAPEKLPKTCPKCHFLKAVGVHICPNCGFAPEVVNEVEHVPGELKKMEVATKETKQKWYSMLLCHAEGKNFNNAKGWTAHKYREKFGVWPQGLHANLVTPDSEVRGYITHLNIKYAKRKRA